MNKYLQNLNRIEVIVTFACSGKCIHCQEGDHEGMSGHIDDSLVTNAIKEVAKVYPIKTLMTFGGEALFYPEVTCAIHKTATLVGIPKRQLITNGYFTNDKARIKQVVLELEKSGVNDILLSVDAFHQATIPTEPVLYFAKCVKKTNMDIKLSPAWLVSREDNNPYNIRTNEIIKPFMDLGIPLGDGNIIFPSGNALKYLISYFGDRIIEANPYDEDPTDIHSLSFSPNGDVLNSNITKKDIIDILEEYLP